MFGTSEAAVAAVLAAFMAGLALGAGVIEWLLRRISRPLHLYAALLARRVLETGERQNLKINMNALFPLLDACAEREGAIWSVLKGFGRN